MSTTTALAMEVPPTSGLTRYRVLIGAIVIQLLLGTIYGYSIFWQPLQSTLFPAILVRTEPQQAAEPGTVLVETSAAADRLRSQQQGYLKYAFSICVLSFAAVMVIAGRVQDVQGPRFTATIGGVLLGSGFILAGLMQHPIVLYLAHAAFTGVATTLLLMIFHALFARLDRDQFPILACVRQGIVVAGAVAGLLLGTYYVGKQGEIDQLLLLWGTVGFLAGAGVGFAYVCPIAALIKWFPTSKGLITGVAVAGFGFGAYIFSHKSFPLSAENFIKTRGIEGLFLLHGLICLVGVSLGATLLRNPPGTPPKAAADTHWQDLLRRPSFYVLWLMYFSGSLAGLMVIGIVKPFAGEQLVAAAGALLDEATRKELLAKGATAVGWLAIFNALGRIVWGFVSDRMGRTVAFVANFLIQACVMSLLASMSTEVTLAVAASVVGFNYGGCFALFPSATAELYGAKNLGVNYGWVFTSYGIAGVVGIAAGNAARTATGSYAAAFIVAAALCVASALLALVLHAILRRQKTAQAASPR